MYSILAGAHDLTYGRTLTDHRAWTVERRCRPPREGYIIRRRQNAAKAIPEERSLITPLQRAASPIAAMFQAPVSWAASKLLAFVFPHDTKARPRSTLDASDPLQTLGSTEWRRRDEARRSLRGTTLQQMPFEARYWPLTHRPRNSKEAQQLYDHIRTVAWYLDSIPLLGSRLPFNVGVESLIGLIPGVGDYVGLILGLYQILLCALFGLPLTVLLWMIFNVVVDCIIGIVPIIGDALDVLFKANLRNLRLLEDHLHRTKGKCGAGVFYIEFPPSDRFLPARQSTRTSQDPPPYASIRHPEFNIPTDSPRRSNDTRPYFLSLPSSVSASTNVGTAASPVPERRPNGHSANVPAPTAKAETSPVALENGTRDAAQRTAKLQLTIEAEAYTIPEESSTPGQGGKTSAAWLHNGTSQASTSDALHDPPPSVVEALPSDGFLTQDDQLHTQLTTDSAYTSAMDSSNKHLQTIHHGPSHSLSLDKERPRVSWHKLARAKSSTIAGPEAKRPSHELFDADDDAEDALEDQRLLKLRPSDREHDIEDPRELWQRRRGMYLLVYSAIFCVAYVTSLDSNTGYLYLNFACSEYGALASFSTVAIVQQMVFAIAKPPIAKLSDVVGRPQAYVLSLVFYVCGYIVVASTASLRSLIGGICLQSAGTTGIQVLQSIIIADTITAKWRGLVIGIVNLPFLINFAVAGPMVDLVMRHGGWRFGFAIWTVIVPLAATPLLLTLLVGQRRARRAGLATRSTLTDKPWRQALRQLATEFDVLGLSLFTGGWLLILLPLTLAGHGERQAQIPMTTFILGGVAMLLVFGWWETRASVPILPYQFLTNSAVVCTCVVGVLDFASFYISWTFLSSFVQILKGWDQTKTGYFATTQNVTSTITGIIVGSLMAMTRRYKMLLMVGLLVRVLGVTLMVRYRTADDPTYMLVLCQLLQGIGGGSIAITMQVAVQVTVRHADVAIVTALELLTTEIGAAIGSATAGWMFQTYLPTKLRENLRNMDADELKAVYGSLQKALSYPIGSDERTAIIKAWVDVMRMLSIVAITVLVPAVLFGMAIPDTSLPDVHGGVSHHHSHHHHQHHQHHHYNHGSRRGERRSSRRQPSFLSASRPSSPLEVRAGYPDITPGMGLGVANEEAAATGQLAAMTNGSKRSRSASRNRASERESRDDPSLQQKKRRSRRAVLH